MGGSGLSPLAFLAKHKHPLKKSSNTWLYPLRKHPNVDVLIPYVGVLIPYVGVLTNIENTTILTNIENTNILTNIENTNILKIK
jgi:hypothetical protein